ncbi:MAG: hypothetical protein EHM50_09185, partial [Lysobacterales bacterium]
MRESTILVVVDLTAGAHQPALERAAWLATQAGARLELFACDYDPDLDRGHVTTVWKADAGPRERLLLQRRSQLEELAAPFRKQGLKVTVDVVWDHPFERAIVKKAAAHDYWLVAKDTHHHNLIQRTLLTNVDWHLVRECPVPLLLVKDRALAAEPHVLAAVDPVNEHDKPAALDDRIFTFAADLARVVRGHLHVMHAYSTPMGAELPPDVVKTEQQLLLENFIRRELLLQRAAELGYRVSDQELAQALASIEALQVDGRFSRDRYAALLRTQG